METMMTETGDSLFNEDDDMDDEDDEMDQRYGYSNGANPYGYGDEDNANAPKPLDAFRRVRAGPPQSNDVLGRKIPPQIVLKRIEKMICKRTMNVSVELVHAAPSTTNEANGTEGAIDEQNDEFVSRRRLHDEFDKLLGLEKKPTNPVLRIISTFLGPLMRMVRVLIYLGRVSFNVSTWKDPILSFWVLVAMSVLCLILLVFPWRSFFMTVVVFGLGPQVCIRVCTTRLSLAVRSISHGIFRISLCASI